mgnify:CR=1 FL=1
MQSLGIPRPVDSMVLNKEKTNLFTLNQKIWSLYNCLDICIFVAAPGHTFTFQHIAEIVEAVTGWKTSTTELLLVGERALTLARLFNLREGLSSGRCCHGPRRRRGLKNASLLEGGKRRLFVLLWVGPKGRHRASPTRTSAGSSDATDGSSMHPDPSGRALTPPPAPA